MKVLLDENLPHDLRYFLAHHQVSPLASLNWHMPKDDRLLEHAASVGFDVLVTFGTWGRAEDDGPNVGVSTITLRAATNTMEDLRPLVVPLLETLDAFRPNTRVVLDEGSIDS